MVSGKTPTFLLSQEAPQTSVRPPLGVPARMQPILKTMDLA